MIAKGKAVSHEAAMMEYAMGKRDAEYVTSHGLLSSPVLMIDMSAREILDEFRQHRQKFSRGSCGRQLQNTILRFELCPTAEETHGWCRDDWINFIGEFIRTLGSLDHVETKAGRRRVPRTDIANTQWVALLYHDGADGCDHIHLLGNRIDFGGRTVSDSFLLAKAELAANIINERRGWKQSFEIAREHREELRNVCLDVLRSMPEWDWDDYFRRIRSKGFECYRRYDSQGRQRGYCIFYGNASIPASEIDRRLTWGKIVSTWWSMHPAYSERSQDSGHSAGQCKPEYVQYDFRDLHGFVKLYNGNCISISKHIDAVIHSQISLPDPKEYEDEEGEYVAPDIEDIVKVAIALFIGYVDGATTFAESHGGGGGSTSGWGREKDDEDERWAMRCAWMASHLCTPAHRPKKALKSFKSYSPHR